MTSYTVLDLDTVEVGSRRESAWMWPRTGRDKKNGDNETGRLCMILNRSRRRNELIRPSFTACGFNANGTRLVAVDEFGNLYGVHVNSGQVQSLRKLGSKGSAIQVSPTFDRDVLVGFENGTVTCVDVEHPTTNVVDYGKDDKTLNGHHHRITSICFHPSWNIACTASTEKLVLWNTSDWTQKKTLGGGIGIAQCEFSPNGELVLVAFRDGTILGWDPSNYTLNLRLQAKVPLNHPRFDQNSKIHFTCFCVSPDSRFLLGGGRGPLLYVWEIRAKALIRVIEMPSKLTQIIQVAFLKDCTSAVVLGDDGVIRIVRALGGNKCETLLELADETGAFLHFSVTTDQILAACLSNGSLSLHDVRAGFAYKHRMERKRRNMGGVPQEDDDLNSTLLSSYAVFKPSDTDDQEAVSTAYEEQELEEENDDDDDDDDVVADDMMMIQEDLTHKEQQNVIIEKKEICPQKQDKKDTEEVSVSCEDLEPPLVRLARDLSRDDSKLNDHQLQKMLNHFGEFPEKYRLMVWRFLLHLPENSSAYSALVRKGTHPSWTDVYSSFPVKSQRVQMRFERVLSALAHWCPLFEQVSYLPAMVFPFVKAFGIDEISAFETVLMVLFRISGDWFTSFPHLPVFLLCRLETFLGKVDKRLLAHFTEHGITSEVYAWPLLRSLFSEVLDRNEWFKLWDHLFMYLEDGPTLVETACVSYLRYFRNTLLSLRKPKDYERFFRTPNPFNVRRWLKATLKLHKQYESFWRDFQEETKGRESQKMVHYLPRGTAYPGFDRYPQFVVDYEATERKRIQQEERELLQKRNILETIREKTAALEKQEAEHIRMQEQILTLEEENRKKHAEQEKKRLKELEETDRLTRLRRLEQVEKMEELARDNLVLQQRLRQTEAQRLNDELEHKAQVQKLRLESRKEEEKIQKLEADAQIKLQKLHVQRQLEQEMQQLRLESSRLNKQGELDWQLREEAWRLEDEKNKTEQDLKLKRAEQHTRVNEISLARRELETKHSLQEVEAQIKLSQLERERKVRHFQQEAANEVHESLEKRLELEKMVSQQESKQREEAMAQHQEWLQQLAQERNRILHEEKKKAIEEARERDIRIARIQAEQERRKFEEEIEKRMREAREEASKEEQSLQNQILSLDDQRRKEGNQETELLMKERQLEETTKFMRAARLAEEEAIKEERKRFQQLRIELAQMREEEENRRMQQLSANLEREAAKRHQDILDKAAQARERAQQAESELLGH